MLYVKGQGQTVKNCSSIWTSGNCEWPLPVHY